MASLSETKTLRDALAWKCYWFELVKFTTEVVVFLSCHGVFVHQTVEMPLLQKIIKVFFLLILHSQLRWSLCCNSACKSCVHDAIHKHICWWFFTIEFW